MKKPSTIILNGSIMGAMLLQSCATIIATPYQSVRVTGAPAGSTVYINDKEVKTKPIAGSNDFKVRVRRKKNAEIKIKHDGYKDHSEVLYPEKSNGLTYLNWVPVLGTFKGVSTDENGNVNSNPLIYGWAVGLGGYCVDAILGSGKKFTKSEIKPVMPALPKAMASSQTIQCGMVNVRLKGGDKMGNFIVGKDNTDILYFGKTLDVDADHLKGNVNSLLKDLGYAVPSSEGKSVFSTGSNSRYTLQGEMRDVKYDIYASHIYEYRAHYETRCAVEVTWKLQNQNRQTIFEHKDGGSSVKFEKGGSAAFEDAFENSLYAFLSNKEVTTALAKPAGTSPAAAAEADKPAAIAVHRAVLPKATTTTSVSLAAKSVVIVETTDGHGSGCIISNDGYIVTNAHVVGEEADVKVLMADGLEAKGRVVRVNAEMDLALIKINTDGLTAFQLPTTSSAEIGADVFAIGTPADKELGQSITKGIISGRRKIEGHTLLQTDVSINGGNSGGALVSHGGQLLGIVNAKLVGRGIEGIGFAIPAEQVADALQLKFID
ncbi:S1C family serine protease [Hymenobacter negativus]|uniref:Serine protease n=1 Tax=Hymenobacter negativus TaxID=2795026 RepID=A0ABS0Q2A7_9BACT|nr:S1C family serine protease [Hymenobacter negativus]MBH8556473.1 serine protease [Hymenobacter negativus]